MTVKEFREQLKKYPDNMQVVVSGYETGWDDIEPDSLSIREVLLNCGERDYEGQHEDLFFVKKEKIAKGKIAKVLTISRTSY